MIKLVMCCDVDGHIGHDNKLIYHIKGDLKNFKKMTEGKKVIMGYNTWESLPNKPLPNRTNIILTSKDEKLFPEDVVIIRDIESIRTLASEEDVIVIGGGELVNELIRQNMIDEAFLTYVHRTKVVANKSIDILGLFLNLTDRKSIMTFEEEPFKAELLKCTRGKCKTV